MNRILTWGEMRLKMYPNKYQQLYDFYRTYLGLDIIHEWCNDREQGAMFRVGAGVIELLSGYKPYQPVAGCSVSLEVSQVELLWERCKTYDRILFPLRHNDWGDTSFKISDPEGLEITFFTKDRPTKITTLVFLVKKVAGRITHVCLARKKRGFGTGNGGKKENNETVYEAAVRETQASIAKAKGEAEAQRVRAEAEAYANKIIAGPLSPDLIRYLQTRKWDGKLPQVTSGTNGLLLQPNLGTK